jgi:PAS domain S-box-containing protein
MNANKLLLLSDIESSNSLPEQVVRALMETSDVGIAVIQGMCIKFTNQQFLDRIKYSRDELEAKYVTELIHPDDVDYLVKKYAGISNGSVSANEPLEFRCVAKDETVIHVEAKATLIQWEGALAGLCLFWDVEKQKVIEEYLRREVKRRADIIDGLSERLIHTDGRLKIVLANRAASESAGISLDEIVGRFCYDVFRNGDGPCDGCPAQETVTTGRAAEGRVVYPDGRTWMIQSYPVMGEDNEPAGSIIKCIDMTDREEREGRPGGRHLSQGSAGSELPEVLAAPADPHYLYPFQLEIDYHDGHIVSTLGWLENGRAMVLAKLGRSELASVRLLYLAARMKTDGEGWVDKDSIRAGKMDYNLYELRKAFEESSIPWLDTLSARMLVRSKGEGSGLVRLALFPENITILPGIAGFRSDKHKRLQTIDEKIAKLTSGLSRRTDDEYLVDELKIQKENRANTQKSIDTIETLFTESLRLLGISRKNF